jgi:transposase
MRPLGGFDSAGEVAVRSVIGRSSTIRSERLLMEQLEYNLLFRWFIGLNMDEPVWVPTVFSKNRERLLDGDIAESFSIAC